MCSNASKQKNQGRVANRGRRSIAEQPASAVFATDVRPSRNVAQLRRVRVARSASRSNQSAHAKRNPGALLWCPRSAARRELREGDGGRREDEAGAGETGAGGPRWVLLRGVWRLALHDVPP